MTLDISGFGLQVSLVASQTFPAGINLTQFADDTDPFDLPSLKQADVAMGLNGDKLSWSKAIPIKNDLAVIPGSDDDINLAILADANRVGKGKNSVRDIITLVGIYPDGSTVSLTDGTLTDAMPGSSVKSDGRLKSKVYMFAFGGITRTTAST